MRGFLAVVFGIGLAPIPNFTDGVQDIAVPSYAYPCFTTGCTWEVFKAGATIVIINPNSGPIFPFESILTDYAMLVTTVKQSSTVQTVLGYVLTGYGNRDSSLVLSDIDTYYHNYSTNIDGIFLDEGSPSCDTTNLTTYKLYDDRVKTNWGSGGFTALNWGAPGSECYLMSTSINTFCTFEGMCLASFCQFRVWTSCCICNTPSMLSDLMVINLSFGRKLQYIYFICIRFKSRLGLRLRSWPILAHCVLNPERRNQRADRSESVPDAQCRQDLLYGCCY